MLTREENERLTRVGRGTRRMPAEQIDKVERAEEPEVAVVRDPAQNECITFDVTTPWFETSNAG
jgi:hypothetical protein